MHMMDDETYETFLLLVLVNQQTWLQKSAFVQFLRRPLSTSS